MNHSDLTDHELFLRAISSLSEARSLFQLSVERGIILGNDNHIGDIGEYWVKRYYEMLGKKAVLGTHKVSPYDILLPETGDRISVKTITDWSTHGKGTPVKPLDGRIDQWNILAVVQLSTKLLPTRISIIPLTLLLLKPEFVKNIEARSKQGTKTYPSVNRKWKWLRDHEVDLSTLKLDSI